MRWVALALLLVACDGAELTHRHAAAQAPLTPDARGCVPSVVPLPASIPLGMSVAHNYQRGGAGGYGTETSRRTLRELRALGVRDVSLTPFGFMRALDATEVELATERPEAENDVRMEAEIRAAHALGLRVFLKPHVWIAGGAWRGELAPAGEHGWARFFESYARFVLHYAAMAERLGVERFAIGVELPTGPANDALWRALVRDVRRVYRGEITFAANWDAVERVGFFAELDYVGVQLYPSLAAEPGASEASLRAALDRRLDALGRVARRTGRPLLITEVGYKSIEGTEVHPHEWPERHGRPRVSELAQARAYARLIASVSERSFVRGVYFWKWFTDPDAREEGPDGFSPRDKLAEAVVRSASDPRCRH